MFVPILFKSLAAFARFVRLSFYLFCRIFLVFCRLLSVNRIVVYMFRIMVCVFHTVEYKNSIVELGLLQDKSDLLMGTNGIDAKNAETWRSFCSLCSCVSSHLQLIVPLLQGKRPVLFNQFHRFGLVLVFVFLVAFLLVYIGFDVGPGFLETGDREFPVDFLCQVEGVFFIILKADFHQIAFGDELLVGFVFMV